MTPTLWRLLATLALPPCLLLTVAQVDGAQNNEKVLVVFPESTYA